MTKVELNFGQRSPSLSASTATLSREPSQVAEKPIHPPCCEGRNARAGKERHMTPSP